MDTFLTDLYDRGLSKVAVAGPSTPPKPEASAVKPLDADSKAPAKKSTPPEEPTAAEKKAELVLTAMRATRNAPGHVKQAAAEYLGQRLAGIKTAGLPKFLKDHTKVRDGMTYITKWPKDERLHALIGQHQAGKLNQPLYKRTDSVGSQLREMKGKPNKPGSQADYWDRAKKDLRGETPPGEVWNKRPDKK